MTKHLPLNILFGSVGFNVLYIFSACFEILGYVNFTLNMNENKKEEKREIKREALNEKLPGKAALLLLNKLQCWDVRVSFVCIPFAWISNPYALPFFEPDKCDSKQMAGITVAIDKYCKGRVIMERKIAIGTAHLNSTLSSLFICIKPFRSCWMQINMQQLIQNHAQRIQCHREEINSKRHFSPV